MLMQAIHYSYINSKIRCLKSSLLTNEDYKNIEQSQSISGFIDALKSTPYGEGCETVSSYEDMISLYYRSLFNDYIKIIDNMSGENMSLILHLFHRYEMENVKVVLRGLCYGKGKEEMEKLLFPLMKHWTVTQEKLLDAKDIFELIQMLKGTSYYDPLNNSVYRFEKEGDTFPLEMALDLHYYKMLWEISSLLSGRDKKTAQYFIGSQLDALNILWSIRFKENYNFSPEEILNYTLMEGVYITKGRRKKMAYSIDRKDIIGSLDSTPYKKILNGTDTPEEVSTLLLNYLFSMSVKNWYGCPFQIGTILDYLLFKEIEARNLLIITESKRRGLPGETVNRYLINVTL